MGAIPIDYQQCDFVEETRRLTRGGADVVFDGIGGRHMWESRRRSGRGASRGLWPHVVAARRALGSGRRHKYRGLAIYALYILGGWVLPGRKRVIPYSIQWLKRRRPDLFRQDLTALLDLLKQQKIAPLIAEKLPLAEARRAHERLGEGA